MGVSKYVALLAEGVDRNTCDRGVANELVVALLAEGVDRNNSIQDCYVRLISPSPSSRRAWIEIGNTACR